MKKLWEVTVNQWGWDSPKTYYATSRKDAEAIAKKYPASDPVRYSGNYSDDKAEWLLSGSIQTFENWLKDKSW